MEGGVSVPKVLQPLFEAAMQTPLAEVRSIAPALGVASGP
jgi:hypothetical protein